MDQPSFSVVRLNPKGDARAIRHGFPWVYANEVVTDRRTKAMTAGTIAILEDAERRPMGLVAVNTASKIFCRMLERDVDVAPSWFSASNPPRADASLVAGAAAAARRAHAGPLGPTPRARCGRPG